MVTRIQSISYYGLNTIPVQIEVDIQTKVPLFEIVGMACLSVKESVRRIETAIQNSGFHFPGKRIIVNLAPAGIKKFGTLFDLPIAIGILAENINFKNINDIIIVGELSLDGSIRHISGALPIAERAKRKGAGRIICPASNAREMSVIEGIEIIPVNNLKETADYLAEITDITAYRRVEGSTMIISGKSDDMADIKGQKSAKRALEISAAGAHNTLMVGPPGTGKTMLARRIPGILPGMTVPEAIETTMIYSVAGLIDPDKPMIMERPFRTPHHTSTLSAIAGGGSRLPKPGEISLAHNGVLFMDEFQQFHSNVLQVLREPLEEEKITISRSEGSLEFPANFMLVAALNPSRRNIDIDRMEINEMKAMLSRLSGPLLDRIDIQIQVPRINYNQIRSSEEPEKSVEIRKRVNAARQIQSERFRNEGIFTNSQMKHKMIERYCRLSTGGESLLKLAMEKFLLSIRAYDKILKIARTIADIEKDENIRDYHVSEALGYRVLDRLLNFV